MTTACKCDKCGVLFEFTPGDVRVEYHVTTKVDTDGAPTQQGYELDLCHECSKAFLTHVEHRDAT